MYNSFSRYTFFDWNSVCKDGNKQYYKYVVIIVLCVAVYWIYKEKNKEKKEKENYLVRENVKDISTFLF